MTSARILLALKSYLEPLTTANGGVFELSGTPQGTLELLKAAPVKWRCILQWQREDQVGSSSAMIMRYLIVVQQAKGLSVDRGADVQTGRAGDPAILSRLTQVCDWLRAAKLEHHQIDSSDMNPRSKYWLIDDSFPSRQAAAEFSLAYGCDPVEGQAIQVPV